MLANPLSSRSRRRRTGEGAIGAVAAIGLILLLVASYIAWALVPVWTDYLTVQEICRTVVLDWVNHENLHQAEARFDAELRRKSVSSESVHHDDCIFTDTHAAWEVDCVWTQLAYYPGTDYYKAFPLRVHVIYQEGKAVMLHD